MEHGGVRPNSGRKSKAEELGLKEKLSPLEPLFLKALAKGLKEESGMAMKLYAEYFYGKPTERVEHSGINGQPIETKSVVEFRDYGGTGNNSAVQSAIQAGIRN